jgi:hypothetical protein
MKNLNHMDELVSSLFNKYDPKEIPDLYNIYKNIMDSFNKLFLESINTIWNVFNAKLRIAAMINMLIALIGVMIKNHTFSIIVIVMLTISLISKIYKYFKIKYLVRKAIDEFPLTSAKTLSITINSYLQSNDKYSGTVSQEDIDQLNELAAKCVEYSNNIMKGLNNER